MGSKELAIYHPSLSISTLDMSTDLGFPDSLIQEGLTACEQLVKSAGGPDSRSSLHRYRA